MSGPSRRTVLSYTAGVGAAAAAGVMHKDARALARPPARPAIRFPEPRVLASRDGVLDVTLTGRPAWVDLGAPHRALTYTFDGTVPGYTWEIRGGDTLRVLLRNRLPPLREPVMRMDRPHEWTTLNLHTHGLHVSPSGDADNVFLTIPPGADHQLEIPVPGDHPGGIFWYHPHHHGAVTQHLRAGMAGTLIVRGAIDEVPEVAAAAERVMVLQGIELGADYRLQAPDPDPPEGKSFWPKDQTLYTVNGQLAPVLRMYPGEVQRWRLLNAAASVFMSLALTGHQFHVLAWDGLTLPAPEAEPVLMLSPGNRAEVLVRAPQPGLYHLIMTPGTSQEPDIPGMPESGRPGQAAAAMPMRGFPVVPGELIPRVILTLEVSGHGPAMSLPRSLPAYDPPILPIARRRDFAFTIQQTAAGKFDSFGVDGIPYSTARRPYQPVLGTAEKWTLSNAPDPETMTHAHVFHIHTNPFKITKRNGKALDPPLWRDTYVLTKSDLDSITFESNFTDFTGKFVEHCHIVSHEDLGMMSAIEVVRPGRGRTA
jgi:FtsP/CotA-like multicopper oxidase with cupredoxin domain